MRGLHQAPDLRRLALIRTAYDDGGRSGGTMERPALKRLVVYKVDRLTRSLADFAKMVEVLDAHRVSFVAVTQQFKHHHLYGAPDAQCPALLRPVRATR